MSACPDVAVPQASGSSRCDHVSFSLGQWAAWSPGLRSRESWLRWAASPGCSFPGGEDSERDSQAPVDAMPAMLRRRAQRLGRMALEVLYSAGAAEAPIVYCSRHGELQRAVTLLGQLVDTGALSPQDFSVAVHNAIAGLYSIATSSRVNVVGISGGVATPFSGIIEACGLIADGADRVRLVLCDEPLPAIYSAFADPGDASYAVLLELTAGADYSMEWGPAAAAPVSPPTPAALELVRFLLGSRPDALVCADRRAWRLRRMLE